VSVPPTIMIMHLLPSFILLLLLSLPSSFTTSDGFEDDPSPIIVEHDIDGDGVFTHRGSATLKSAKGDVFVQENLSPTELNSFNELARKSRYYHIRARSENSPTWIRAHTKICYLQSSNLVDYLKFHIGSKGQLYALSYSVPTASDDACTQEQPLPKIAKSKFSTTVDVDYGVEAPRPGVEPPPPTAAEKKVEEQQNASFISKYWVYIVPAVLIMVLNGFTANANAPEGGANAEGAQQGAGARGAAPRKR